LGPLNTSSPSSFDGFEAHVVHIDHGRIHIDDGHAERSPFGSVEGIAVADGRAFGHAVTFLDLSAGAPLPSFAGGLVQGVGPAYDDFEPLPVDPAGLVVLLEIFVQSGNAVKGRGLVALDGIENLRPYRVW
jgi:hypothetical protein